MTTPGPHRIRLVSANDVGGRLWIDDQPANAVTKVVVTCTAGEFTTATVDLLLDTADVNADGALVVVGADTARILTSLGWTPPAPPAPPGEPRCPAYPCTEHPELADLLGHDRAGHRIHFALLRDGYTTVEGLRAASDQELRDIRRIGARTVAFIRERTGQPTGGGQ